MLTNCSSLFTQFPPPPTILGPSFLSCFPLAGYSWASSSLLFILPAHPLLSTSALDLVSPKFNPSIPFITSELVFFCLLLAYVIRIGGLLIPSRSHTVDEIREAVRKDNKQRFSLLEENGELLIRANQGHTITAVESERLLKAILSADEIPVCAHGTYKNNLESILASGLKRMKRLHVHFSCGLPMDGKVISGMRRDVNVLIFLDVKKALEEGMKLYISENKVVLTEGFDGVVPVKYFERIVSWPDRQPISF